MGELICYSCLAIVFVLAHRPVIEFIKKKIN